MKRPRVVEHFRRPQGVFSAVHLFYALHEALTMILEEGLPKRFARHVLECCGVPRRHHCLRLQTIAKSEVASPTVTCVCLPGRYLLHRILAPFSSGSRPGYPAGDR